MNVLVATVGLSNAGKSTWARDQACPVVNPDSIRLALTGQPFVPAAEPFVWAIAKVMVRSLFRAGHRLVILDATNTTAARRQEWQTTEWATYFKVFDTPRDVCVERALAAGREDLVEVIVRMADKFEPLAPGDLRWPS